MLVSRETASVLLKLNHSVLLAFEVETTQEDVRDETTSQ